MVTHYTAMVTVIHGRDTGPQGIVELSPAYCSAEEKVITVGNIILYSWYV